MRQARGHLDSGRVKKCQYPVNLRDLSAWSSKLNISGRSRCGFLVFFSWISTLFRKVWANWIYLLLLHSFIVLETLVISTYPRISNGNTAEFLLNNLIIRSRFLKFYRAIVERCDENSDLTPRKLRPLEFFKKGLHFKKIHCKLVSVLIT